MEKAETAIFIEFMRANYVLEGLLLSPQMGSSLS